MKKKKIIIATVVIVVLILVVWLGKAGSDKQTKIYATVEQGDFEVVVTVTGELQALNSTLIEGPIELRTSRGMRFTDIAIQDMVAEGTVVEQGDYVATLDKTSALNSLREMEDAITEAESALLQVKLDTAISLRGLRDQIKNLEFEAEESKITLEQSKYESPSTQRQAQIAVEKSERALSVAINNYSLEKQKYAAKMVTEELDLEQQLRRRDEMTAVMDKFTITAPQKGMVIYYKDRGGQKRKAGSSISPFDLTVATLPDLTVMNSLTYVNEIDVSRVKAGQKVRVGVDAFPNKSYTGVVSSVANIGEQLSNTDSKVFETVVQVNEYDPILRPSMTTSNKIVINTLPDVLYLPLEAIFGMDSIPVVYKANGTKQVVLLGETNENQVVVEKGLEKGEKVYLSAPENAEKMKLGGEELIPTIQERAREKALKDAVTPAQTSPAGRPQGFPGGAMPAGMTPGQMPAGMTPPAGAAGQGRMGAGRTGGRRPAGQNGQPANASQTAQPATAPQTAQPETTQQ